MIQFPQIGDIIKAPWLVGPMLILDVEHIAPNVKRYEIFSLMQNHTGDTIIDVSDLDFVMLVVEVEE